MKKSLCLIAFLIVLAFNANCQNNTLKNSGDSILTPSVAHPVQVMPNFPGGPAEFGRFLKSNIHYPIQAVQNKIEGRAIVTFVVEKDGSLSNLTLVKDPGAGLGDEAIRVLKLSPKWSPGQANNKFVRVQFTIPVNFTLPKTS